MMDLTSRLLQGRSVATVFVTHSRREAQRPASRTVRLTGSPAVLVEVAPEG
jgi:ABC-type nitrate/sulfonate/bicarbonate transport system ATPase subunit